MANTTWKQVVYDVADAYREADGSTAKIPVGNLADLIRQGAGGEDVTEEVTEYETLLETAITNLTNKIAPAPIVINEGEYVWKKLTAEGGEFIDYVVADDEASYPDGALGDDGYWYELISQPVDLADEMADLIPSNIREGIDIFGIIGSMSEGVPLPYGITSYNVSYQTFSSRKTLYGSFNHGDNKTPQMIIIFPNGDVSNATSASYPHLIYAMVLSDGGTTGELIYRQKGDTGNVTSSRTVCSLTSATVSVTGYIYTSFQAGVEYGFITMA